jgi:2-polyprenyl-3-methyl-5-hydroxy-6-metoxy-1,4-benzoquinol methylase
MKKADYSKIAFFYDRGRTLSEQNMELWLGAIARISGARKGSRLLDLGCGTGRFAIPMAANFGYRVTGADSSAEMLEKAREKDSRKAVEWDLQDAQNLSYPDKSFDIVFMSHLLHHCDEPFRVIRECRRVLTKSGALIIRYAGIEQIRDDVEHTFFPETLPIDEARIFSVEKVEKELKEAGFINIISEEFTQQTYLTAEAHLEAMLVKSTSVLTMIPEEAFERGVARLKKYIEEKPDDPWLLYDRMTLAAGFKAK